MLVPLTVKFPEIATLFEKVLFPPIVCAPVVRTTVPSTATALELTLIPLPCPTVSVILPEPELIVAPPDKPFPEFIVIPVISPVFVVYPKLRILSSIAAEVMNEVSLFAKDSELV